MLIKYIPVYSHMYNNTFFIICSLIHLHVLMCIYGKVLMHVQVLSFGSSLYVNIICACTYMCALVHLILFKNTCSNVKVYRDIHGIASVAALSALIRCMFSYVHMYLFYINLLSAYLIMYEYDNVQILYEYDNVLIHTAAFRNTPCNNICSFICMSTCADTYSHFREHPVQQHMYMYLYVYIFIYLGVTIDIWTVAPNLYVYPECMFVYLCMCKYLFVNPSSSVYLNICLDENVPYSNTKMIMVQYPKSSNSTIIITIWFLSFI